MDKFEAADLVPAKGFLAFYDNFRLFLFIFSKSNSFRNFIKALFPLFPRLSAVEMWSESPPLSDVITEKSFFMAQLVEAFKDDIK